MAAATEEKTESAPAAAAPAAAPGGGSKLTLILTGVNLFVTIAMVAILFISFQKDKKKPQVTDLDPHAEAAAEGEKGKEGEGAKKEGGHGGGEAGKGERKTAEFGKMVTLEQFVVNLSTPGSTNPRFVRVNVSLEVPSEDSEAEVNAKVPQIRNVIIDLFNSKRPSDLANAEGRDFLKDEIKNALNGFLVRGKVRGVFFTNFALSS